MTDGPTTPAGWYPDPERPGEQRYWDGAAWTEHRSGAPAAVTPAPPPESEGARPGGRGRWLVAGGVVAIIALIAGFVLTRGDDDDDGGGGGGIADPALGTFEGELLWQVDSGLGDEFVRFIGATGDTAIVAAEASCASCDDLEIVALDTATGEVRWSRALDPGVLRVPDEFPALVVDGRVLVLESTGDDANDLVALDTATGEEAWRARADIGTTVDWLPAADVQLLVRSGDDGSTIAGIDDATGEERFVIGSDDGLIRRMWAVHAQLFVVSEIDRSGDDRTVTNIAYGYDGQERWRAGGELAPALDYAPAVDAAIVVLPTTGGLIGVDAIDRAERWSIGLPGDPFDTRVLFAHEAGVALTCAETGDDGADIEAISLATGEVSWSEQLETIPGALGGGAGIAGAAGGVVVVSTNGSSCAGGSLNAFDDGVLRGLDLADGSEVWSRRIADDDAVAGIAPPGIPGPSWLRVGPALLQITEFGDVAVLIDPTSGEELHRGRAEAAYIVGSDIAVFDLEAHTASPIGGGEAIDVGVRARPLAFVDGVLYVVALDGLVSAID